MLNTNQIVGSFSRDALVTNSYHSIPRACIFIYFWDICLVITFESGSNNYLNRFVGKITSVLPIFHITKWAMWVQPGYFCRPIQRGTEIHKKIEDLIHFLQNWYELCGNYTEISWVCLLSTETFCWSNYYQFCATKWRTKRIISWILNLPLQRTGTFASN